MTTSTSAALACLITLVGYFAFAPALRGPLAARNHADGAESQAPTPSAEASAAARAREAFGALPLQFEANRGQTDARVKFLARGGGYNLFLTPGEAVFALHKPAAADATEGTRAELKQRGAAVERAVLKMRLLGANPSPSVEGQQPLEARSNYFVGGGEASRAQVSAETYARVRYANVYGGVDAVYYGNQRQLEYDFVVHPRADPGQIAVAFEGAQSVEVDGEGGLSVQTALGEVRQHRPVVYQETAEGRREVEGRYVVRQTPDSFQVGFELGDYDASKTLVIDPVLVYSTYHGGGSSLDAAHGVAVDAAGNAYLTGETISLDFPTSADAFQKTHGGSNYDAYVTKLNATGTAIVYSTYLGGAGQDQAYDLAVDADGNAYVAGRTTSENFPTTPGAFQPAFGGGLYPGGLGGDAFVTKLNPQGTGLVYSTYLGGSATEYGYGVALDASRNAYVTGSTASDNFPVLNALQPARRGNTDAFVTKLDAGGTSLVYSTYFGGATTVDSLNASGLDNAFDIAVDSAGAAYVVGETQTTDFPVTANAFQRSFNGLGAYEGDAYVAKLSAEGNALVYSTYLGGGYGDSGSGIAVDAGGHAYVTGQTASVNFPVVNAFQPALANVEMIHDAFVTKLSPDGATAVYSTYLGGNTGDSGTAVAVDAVGNAYVTGTTNSSFFPLRNAVQGTLNGKSSEAFVTKLNPSGAALVYSTFLGGTGNEMGNAIALDGAGDAYVVGGTTSLGFPTTDGALRRTRNGQGDAFVSKIHVGEDEPTYKIGGRVTGAGGAPLAGVEINIFGGARAHTLTSAEGTYSFDGLRAGALYSLTAYTPCGSFTTPNDTVNNLSSDQTVDFTGSVTTFTISGNITNPDSTRRSGVLITLSGAQAATATTDANGEYSFANLPGCRDYTVTPSEPGQFFTLPSRTYTYLSMNQPFTSFRAAPLSDNRPPIVSLYPQSATHVAPTTVVLNAYATDTTGRVAKVDFYAGTTLIGTDPLTAQEVQMGHTSYQVNWNVTEPGTYAVTAVATDSAGATATSGPKTFTILSQAEAKPFVVVHSPSQGASYEMPATVLVYAEARATEGRTVSKVEFYLGDGMGMNLKPLQTDTTAPYGWFELTDLGAGDYSVYAYAYDNTGAVAFSEPTYFTIKAPPVRHTLSGRAAYADGAGIGGATVTLTGPVLATATTDANGNYQFDGLVPGESYNVTASKPSHTFAPDHLTFDNVGANITSADFKGTRTGVTISGRVTDAGGNALPSNISLTGPYGVETTTDAEGFYSFEDLPAGASYTVRAWKEQYTFEPPSRTFDNLTSDQTGNFNGAPVPAVEGLQYYPLPRPVRVLDTRPGQAACFNPATPLAPGMVFTQKLTGTCDGLSIPDTARAVVGNATVVNTTSSAGPGYVTLYPAGAKRPVVSNINYVKGQVLSNAYTTSLGAGGGLSVYAHSQTHMILDVAGYYAPPAQGGLYYHALPKPMRLLDTRLGQTACDAPGSPLQAKAVRAVNARLTCEGVILPSDALAVVGNVTAVNVGAGAGGDGFFTLYPNGAARPTVSNINFLAGQVLSNSFTVGLGPDGVFNLYSLDRTDVVVDVSGYYSASATPDVNGAAGLHYYPLAAPVRLLDTRAGEPACFNPAAPLAATTSRTQAATGACQGQSVPSAAQAVVGNATVVNTTPSAAPGYVTFFPSGATRPPVSNINYAQGQVLSNAFNVALGGGAFRVYALSETHFIADLSGYYAP